MKQLLILVVLLMVSAANAAEFNSFIQHNNFTIGHRFGHDDNSNHLILRYDLDKKHRVEYRKVDEIDWYRYQYKHIKKNGLFYNSRFEYRSNDVFRYRPQFGYKDKLFIIFEPHFQYEYDLKQTQIFIGREYKNKDWSVVPFLEYDIDEDFRYKTHLYGLELKYKF